MEPLVGISSLLLGPLSPSTHSFQGSADAAERLDVASNVRFTLKRDVANAPRNVVHPVMRLGGKHYATLLRSYWFT